MSRRIAVRAIILRDDKLLCVKLKGYKDAIKSDFWCLPGGTVDEGEPLLDALTREMIEETNVLPVIGNLLYINHFVIEGAEHLEFFFHVKNSDEYLQIDLTKTSHGNEEVEVIDFVDPKNTHILPQFLTTEDIIKQANNPLSTKIFSYL